MNFEKYSKSAFENAGINSDRAKILANELEDAVLAELHQQIEAAFSRIVSRLNSEGHDLSPYLDFIPGEYEYRGKEVEGNCGLRLACDVVISAGYSHLTSDNA
ncbi:hypothetical protein AUP74_02320 [Microbulbifer aggregans]|uniref:Uncharacterized protein n=1 Tax=Microbulbifer aggregans TaxID=1769779 RepID=A0A1C9W9A1_9GAMM|nr:hypothetical protein [Microbulbifer aggregans]AOS97728.1 hypothetical protein AUP74_02320 [Microbulbifer aggregans]